jgi:non-specific serine/threonine protein kinase
LPDQILTKIWLFVWSSGMPDEHWEKIQSLYHQALQLSSKERRRFLASACAGDHKVQREIEALLCAAKHDSVFVEKIVGDAAAQFVADPQVPTLDSCERQLTFPTEGGQTRDITELAELGSRYGELAPVGAGGIGIVFRARDLETGDLVALKFLRQRFEDQDPEIDRFKDELRLARKVTHKNVCRVYEFLRIGGVPCISMEYVQGETLRAYLDRVGRLQPSQVLRIAQQVCSGLREAHREGVIHRDLKPGNLMIDDSGNIRIMDFGLAQSLRMERPSGALIGTPAYMSPEQVQGEQVDGRTDIYAFGLILYEMLTGVAAFSGKEWREVALKRVAETPRLPRDIDPAIPEQIEKAIMKCLEKDPVRRFQSMDELETALMAETPTNLPAPLTSFVGRVEEGAQVRDLLRTNRLLTLIGTGGCGKTRLALQVASEILEQYVDGIWLVELATLTSPSLLSQRVALTLGLREESGRSFTEILAEFLKSRSVLLVLDNCEHLIDASAELSDLLLRSCPRLKILATSREPLEMAGEATWRVPSLRVPTSGVTLQSDEHLSATLCQYDAIKLFIDRASVAQSHFVVNGQNASAIIEVCRHLDGLPLAIELAAAQVRTLTMDQILDGLGDRFRLLTRGNRSALPRQRTLRAAIDWSYELLDQKARILFKRLAVFAGGCSLDAAEAVCAGEALRKDEVLQLLQDLVDKSLAVIESHQNNVRYTFLETLKQYALEQLEQSGTAEVMRKRHADFFLDLSEEAEPKLESPEQELWLRRLEADHANLWASLEWSVRRAPGIAVRMGSALRNFFLVRGYFSEGRQLLRAALEGLNSLEPTLHRASALYSEAILAIRQNDYDLANTLLEESLAISRELGDKRRIAESLRMLAIVHASKGDYAVGEAYFEQSFYVFKELDDRKAISKLLRQRGDFLREQGDYASARKCFQENLMNCQNAGDRRGAGIALGQLGNLAFSEGDLDTARSLFEKGLSIFRGFEDKQNVGTSLMMIGLVAYNKGEYNSATELTEKGLTIFRELGAKDMMAAALDNLGDIARKQHDLISAHTHYRDSLRILQGLGRKRHVPEVLQGLALLALAEGQVERAARLLAAEEGQRESMRTPPSFFSRREREEGMRSVQDALGERFTQTWAEGRAMILEEAISYALRSS